MPEFSSENQPTKRKARGPGRFTAALKAKGRKVLEALIERALTENDMQAAIAVLPYCLPKLRPITPEGSLDAKYLEIKIRALEEIEQRLEALEKQAFQEALR